MTLANNYISHYRTRRSRQRRLWTWVYAGLAICVAMAVYGASVANASEEQSAFVSCMETKVIEVFRPPESVYPMLRLQAQITEREAVKLSEMLKMSPTAVADVELQMEQAKSPRDPEAIMMKELSRQCSKHIKWSGS